mgnify:CR=1 FL=1
MLDESEIYIKELSHTIINLYKLCIEDMGYDMGDTNNEIEYRNYLSSDPIYFYKDDELKASIKEGIEKQNETKAKYETEDDAIEAVCKNAKVEIPSGMIAAETENMEKDMESRLGYQGMNLDNYLQMIGKTRQEFRDEYKPQAEKQVKTRLVLEAIANDAKIEVTEEEISSKISEMAKMYGQKEDDVKNNEHLINYVKENLKTEKTIDPRGAQWAPVPAGNIHTAAGAGSSLYTAGCLFDCRIRYAAYCCA